MVYDTLSEVQTYDERRAAAPGPNTATWATQSCRRKKHDWPNIRTKGRKQFIAVPAKANAHLAEYEIADSIDALMISKLSETRSSRWLMVSPCREIFWRLY
jgi:hypothetical protein